MSEVICPYCTKTAELVDSSVVYGQSYGLIYLCAPCNAYVGIHKNSKNKKPLGTLANRPTREARKRAHAAFDPIWKEGRMSRRGAYRKLAYELKVYQIHIGESDIATCEKIVQIAYRLYPRAVEVLSETENLFDIL